MKKEEIGLYYSMPNRTVGCKKVVENLLKGLKELNIDVKTNTTLPMTGCIHGGIAQLQKKTLPKNTLVGPEIVVMPNENKELFTHYTNWVQPSQWVIDYTKTDPITKNNKMSAWPVGIDTTEFNSDKRGNYKRDCFIYYKTVTNQVNTAILNDLKIKLRTMKLSFEVITYGSYDEKQYKELINTSKFGIFLTGTESQGIAYMEALSMNLPLYVVDIKEFFYKRQNYKFSNNNVSAAPYFDDRCGVKCVGINQLDEFINKLNVYKPREYIMDNHTCKHGAEKYMKILRGI